MASALTHPVVALAMRAGAGSNAVPGRLLALAAVCSVLPDVDSIGFWFGVPYGHLLGHRGLTHSLFFALFVAWVSTHWAVQLTASARTVFLTVFVATASHGILDALTSGGLGVALFSPISNERFFFPWRPIVVSPISVLGFFERRSLLVLASEFLWVWLPTLALGIAVGLVRRRRADL